MAAQGTKYPCAVNPEGPFVRQDRSSLNAPGRARENKQQPASACLRSAEQKAEGRGRCGENDNTYTDRG